MSARELRKTLLDGSDDIVKHMLALASGKDSPLHHGLIMDSKLNQVWDALVPIIQKESDSIHTKARTAEEVITAVCKGKLTVQEGKDLMELLKAQQEIDVLPDLNSCSEL